MKMTVFCFGWNTLAKDAKRWRAISADHTELAMVFHQTYERLAPNFGYDTRKETRIFDPASANSKLMIETCAEIIRRYSQ